MGQTEGGDLADTGVPLSQLDVDLSSLADFRTLLIRELDATVRPAVADINKDHALGVHFGTRNAGVGVQTARERYRDALAASVHNLAQYQRMSELLITAIHTLTTRYRTSDLSARSIMQAINDANAALPPVAPTPAAFGYLPPPANRGQEL